MGVFLETVLFPGGEEEACKAAVRQCSDAGAFSIEEKECRWHVFEKGPGVLLNDGCCGYEDMGENLSRQVGCPVMAMYIYDGDLWGYSLWQNGGEIDRFSSLGDYFGEDEPPKKPGNAKAVGRCFGVEAEAVKEYLIPWDEEIMDGETECYAYDGDEAAIGDCWQITDFMKALGFDYDYLCPKDDAGQRIWDSGDEGEGSEVLAGDVKEPSDGGWESPSGQVFDSREETVLPNALTDRAYVLLRAGEIGERYGEIAGMIERKQYENAVSLITDAVWTAQDNPVLYLLRAFCWNQMEGIKMGLSRRPDMDRDLTKVLELEPDNIMALRARCPVTATVSRYKRHIQDLTRLMELDGENRDSYQVDRAYRFHWVGDDESARRDLEEVLGRGEFRSADLRYLCEELEVGQVRD